MPDVLSRTEMLRRIDEGWRELREGIRHLGRAGMGRRTPTGWTYKDLVGHIAAWEEEAARGLRALVSGGEVPRFGTDDAVDAFNARAVAERRLVGAEAIIDELEAAHRQLVTVVTGLSDEVIADERTQRWIDANTFGHYAEHRDELASHGPTFTAR